tara:strand:+ start:4528 stop:5598 length:1071 start_codon:yes stop_codon:yes gene_type:complete
LKNFWENKKVFLTGHTGFKGGWTSLWLQSQGAKVTGFSLNPNTKKNFFEIAEVSKNMESFIGDIRDGDLLEKKMLSAKPDIVIHMAAQPLVRESYLNPVETYQTNVIGTINVFEAIRKTDSVSTVLNVTSDKCYENKEISYSYNELDPMGGHDPYSNSKGCAELISSAYRRSFFQNGGFDNSKSVGLASVRAGNVIGGGDWSRDRLVPDILKSCENKTPLVLRNPNSIRPWQFILEPIGGYLLLCEKLFRDDDRFSGGWNFGPIERDTKTVQWIVNYFLKKSVNKFEYILSDEENPHEANLLTLDISKAKNQLDWKPKLNLSKALDNVISWQKALLDGKNMNEFSLSQIENYLKLK